MMDELNCVMRFDEDTFLFVILKKLKVCSTQYNQITVVQYGWFHPQPELKLTTVTVKVQQLTAVIVPFVAVPSESYR